MVLNSSPELHSALFRHYVTTSYTDSASTVPPTGSTQGTVITKVYVGYVTTTNYGSGQQPGTSLSTVPPSGSQSGTVIASVDPGYTTTTDYVTTSYSGNGVSTVPPTGSTQGTVVTKVYVGYVTTTNYGTQQQAGTSFSTVAPSGSRSGTVIASVDPGYTTTTTYVTTSFTSPSASTIPPTGSTQGTVITKVYVGYVTTTNYGTGAQATTQFSTVAPSGSQSGTVIASVDPGYTTMTTYVTTSFTSGSVSTVPPTGSTQGTVVTKVYVGYVTTTNYGTGAQATTQFSTVAPSGSQSGTVIASVDPGYTTSTTCVTGSTPGNSTRTAVSPTGSTQGSVVVSSTPGYTTITTQYQATRTSQTAIVTSTSATPSACQSGTVVVSYPVPFQTAACSTNGYLIQRQTLYSVDIETGATNQIATLNVDANVNGIGYNVKDNLLYGTVGSSTNPRIIAFNAQGEVSNVLNATASVVGDVDENGQLWLADSNAGTWRQYSLTRGNAALLGSGSFGTGYAFYDWSYVPNTGNYLWSLNQYNGLTYLIRFDRSSHQMSVIGNYGTIATNAVWGAMYAGRNQRLFASDNTGGQIWSFDIRNSTISNANARLISQGPSTSSNDGARCLNADAIAA
ncbi:hypothetical protein KC354_g15469 [Hortaea werneckii]|nr:hypothetical protein KC354_g15469 [Hortaea werneckii]